MTTTTSGTREVTFGGFDLVMVPEGKNEWTCSVYRTGGQIPLCRKMVDSEAKAAKFFAAKAGYTGGLSA